MRIRGKVRWFNASKGYGFIAPADCAKDIFVHYSQIKEDGYRTLNEGDTVEFTVGQGPKGPQAEEVVRV